LGERELSFESVRIDSSEALRRETQDGLKVIETRNGANSFILHGKGGEIAANDLENQELTMLALHLLQICLVYINTLMIQRVLTEPDWTPTHPAR
jgi:TnpA family transposase